MTARAALCRAYMRGLRECGPDLSHMVRAIEAAMRADDPPTYAHTCGYHWRISEARRRRSEERRDLRAQKIALVELADEQIRGEWPAVKREALAMITRSTRAKRASEWLEMVEIVLINLEFNAQGSQFGQTTSKAQRDQWTARGRIWVLRVPGISQGMRERMLKGQHKN